MGHDYRIRGRSQFGQPSRVAAWLIALFTIDAQEAEAILGDLHERFSQLAAESGLPTARNWYWRQSAKTIFNFAFEGLRTAPLSTSAAIAAGFLTTKLFGFYQPSMTALLDSYQLYETHPHAYVLLLSYGSLISHTALAGLAGALAALAAKGREMIATAVLSIFNCFLTATAFLFILAGNGHIWSWMVPWSFASPLTMLLGGTIVRLRRSRKLA